MLREDQHFTIIEDHCVTFTSLRYLMPTLKQVHFQLFCSWNIFDTRLIYAEEDGQQSTNQSENNWRGFFSISSYTQYFNVDTDIVLNRILSSLYPISGDFFSKIDANPDL